MFGAEQRISKRSSARAVHTRRHTRATLIIWRGARCRYLQPTDDRMVTIMPTESQRCRETGLLRTNEGTFVLVFTKVPSYLRIFYKSPLLVYK